MGSFLCLYQSVAGSGRIVILDEDGEAMLV